MSQLRAAAFLLLLSTLGLAVACGGRVAGEPIPPDDSGTDGAETGGCGVTPCTSGTSCFDGCNTCVCSADGNWNCTLRACVDTGGCPAAQPDNGAPCAGMLSCSYESVCGPTAPNFAVCERNQWHVTFARCVGGCPATEPVSGSYCATISAPGGACRYSPGPGACTRLCSCAPDHRWACRTGDCPPPPPMDAGPPPPSEPCSEGAPCEPGTGCGVPCMRSCKCGSDGRLSCTAIEC